MTLEQRARAAVDEFIMWIPTRKIEDCVSVVTQALADVREADAKVAEGGRFLHDNAPDAIFGRAIAAAIRRQEG
jgi:hypothetical protein